MLAGLEFTVWGRGTDADEPIAHFAMLGKWSRWIGVSISLVAGAGLLLGLLIRALS
jgi:hypothetical protein